MNLLKTKMLDKKSERFRIDQDRNTLPFLDHLEELRIRLIKCLVAVVIAACFFYNCIDSILAFLIKPVGQLVFTSPGGAFNARMTLTLLGAIILASPIILYQIWMFIACGLTEKEKKYIYFYGPSSFLFFFCGGVFAYFVAVPFSIRFLLGFASPGIVPMITVDNYISFVGTQMIAFGIVFELPLILMFLTKIGIATPAFLIEKRRHAIVAILIVSAVVTPSTDIITLLMMAGPLIVLYELGVLASRLTYRENLKK